jgi:hypothetical protein
MANTTELERARPVILVTDYDYESKVKAQTEGTSESFSLYKDPWIVSNFLKRYSNALLN